MPEMRVRITDVETGKTRVRTYRGSRQALETLRKDIRTDRAAYKPPGTAVHTPVPAGVKPGGFIASFLVRDPLEITDDA